MQQIMVRVIYWEKNPGEKKLLSEFQRVTKKIRKTGIAIFPQGNFFSPAS